MGWKSLHQRYFVVVALKWNCCTRAFNIIASY